MMNLKFIKIFFAILLLNSVLFALEQNNKDAYSFCILQNKDTEECKTFFKQAFDIEKYMDFAYTPVYDEDSFMSCVENTDSLSAEQIKKHCIDKLDSEAMITKFFSLFDTKCDYSINDKNKFSLSCKAIVPSTCFFLDVDVNKQSNLGIDEIKVQPYYIYDKKACTNAAIFRYFSKDYDFNINKEKLFVNKQESKIVDTNKNELDVQSILPDFTNLKRNLAPAEDLYFSCLSTYLLFSKKSDGKYLLYENGKIKKYDRADIKKQCNDAVLFSSSINIKTFVNAKSLIKKNMKFLLKDILNYEPGSDKLNELINKLSKNYNIFEENLSKLYDKNVSDIYYNLDLDFFLEKYNDMVKDADPSLKNELDAEAIAQIKNYVYSKARSTQKYLLKDLLNILKDNIEKSEIRDKAMVSIIKDYFIDKNKVDENISLKANKNFFIIEGISLTLKKLHSGDLTLELDNNLIKIDKNSFVFYSDIELELKKGKLYYNEKEILFPKKEWFEKKYVKDYKILLTEERKIPIYKIDFILERSLLGIFKVEETVTEIYNAYKGIKVAVSKPWWDFLLFN